MGVQFTNKQFDNLLTNLAKSFRVYGPKRVAKKAECSDADYIGYGSILTAADLITESKSYFSPKEFVFPPRETLFEFEGGAESVPLCDETPIIVFVRACDIHGIDRLDRLFLGNGTTPDFYYQRRRKLLHFFLIECTSSFDSCFCGSMGTNSADEFAVALQFTGDNIVLTVKDPTFVAYVDGAGVESTYVPIVTTSDQISVTIPAPENLTLEIFDHDLWQEYTRRCIACGRCNTSCPTCSCFTMQDVPAEGSIRAKRRRRWAGCHVGGFPDMAGGHSFRKKNGERMRYKTLHKISDFKQRFGVHQCVGCGRCTDVCPELISFSHCINKLSSIAKMP